jgi:uncharacterized protein (TIGR02722 family)
MMRNFIVYIVLVFLFLSCGSIPSVNRIPSNSLTDLSGYWNNTDVRIVCDSLIDSCLNSPRIAQFTKDKNRLPRIKIGTFKNNTDEHLDPTIIPNTMKVVITNSGRAEFVADSATQNELRVEKQDQLGNASDESAAGIGNETGADFMLTGSVKTIVDRAGLTSTRTYIVNAELTHIESSVIYWTDENSEIKKIIQQAKVKF